MSENKKLQPTEEPQIPQTDAVAQSDKWTKRFANTKVGGHIVRNIYTYVPLLAFVFLFILFAILSGGVSVSSINIKNLLNRGVLIATISTAAVFVYSLGMLDISVGAVVALSTILGSIVFQATGSVFLTFLTIEAVCISLSVLSAICISTFNLPSFVVTLVIMNVLSALSILIVKNFTDGGNIISVQSPEFVALDTVWLKVIGLLVVLLVGVFIFNFTKLGRQNKIIGANQLNAIQSGINVKRNIIISFALMGAGVAVGAFLLLTYVRAGSASNGSTYGFDIMLALVLGGMPISGGPKSNIFAGAIGAFTITELNIGMLAMGIDSGIIQIVRGVVFLLILVLLGIRSRSKYLV